MNIFPIELLRCFENAIMDGQLTQGKELSVSEWARRFQTTEDAMGLVLQAEQRKGLVDLANNQYYRILGVSKPSIESVFQHTSKSGLSPESIVRAVKIEAASKVVADKLQMLVGAPVYRQERTRLVNGEVLANQCNYIPYEVCPDLEKEDLSHRSFQETLEQQFHAIIAKTDESFELVPATSEDLVILGLPSGSQVLIDHSSL